VSNAAVVMMTFDDAVAALPGGRFEGVRYRARCPAHSGEDRNLAVWADEQGVACFKCWSRGCATREIIAAIGTAPAPATFALRQAKAKPADEAERTRRALEIWYQSREPRGTIVQDYLFGRGWTGEMPKPLCAGADPVELARSGIGLALPASIKFHPRLWYAAGVYLPGMVAAIEDRYGCIVGVHRTYLKPDGTGKAEVETNKKALGRGRGCAVHLTAGASELALCEGIETGLSILHATGLRVWPVLGTSNLGQIELPDFVRKVIIAADHDDRGMEAASVAREAYRARGYEVQILSPRNEGRDFNQVVEAGRNNGRAQGV
jgi:hypothetical protein